MNMITPFAKIRPLFGTSLALLLILSGCKTGYNRTFDGSNSATEVGCDQSISNSSANAVTKAIFDNLVALSCGNAGNDDGVLMGQSVGTGNQLVSDDDDVSYMALVEALKNEPTDEDSKGAGDTASIISLDYELDKLYTVTEIEAAHEKIKEHWDEGGLITISWTPLNPWINDGSNPANDAGDLDDTLYSDDVDLAALVTANSGARTLWSNRLIFIAQQLEKLQTLGVTVLWRPFPEMNAEKYWYGAENIGDEATDEETEEVQQQIRNLWIDMYTFFASRNLNNLLWVYSPAESDFLEDTQTADWAFPVGESESDFDRYVDIVAPVVFDDNLLITDYDALLELERPLGAARLSPKERSATGDNKGKFADGEFDNEAHTNLKAFPAIAYWVSWHNYTISNIDNEFALIDNQNTKALVDDDYIISLDKLSRRNFRSTGTSTTTSNSSN